MASETTGLSALAERAVGVQAVLREWLSRVRLAGSARVQVDIDPYSFL